MQRPWGRNQPEVWGTNKKARVIAEERGDAKWKMRPEKEPGLNGLSSMAKTLELKCDMKPWTWDGFGYRVMAQSQLSFQMIPLAAVHKTLSRGKGIVELEPSEEGP